MSKLVEEVAKYLVAEITTANYEEIIEYAEDILSLIQNHPETLERRRKDFEAAARCSFGPFEQEKCDKLFAHYLAAEKEQGK